MWTELRIEIDRITKDFGLTDTQFKPVRIHDWPGIEDKVYHTFCKHAHHKSRPIWLWEHFKLDTFAVSPEQKPYTYLDKLISINETVWFIVNESVNETTKFWIYQGQVKPIQTIISEASYIDEVYLVSKKFDWLICINHHNVLITTGNTMTDKLRQLEQSISPSK